MPQQKYVSTDPNFGAGPDDKKYASTDPNFGMEPEPSHDPDTPMRRLKDLGVGAAKGLGRQAIAGLSMIVRGANPGIETAANMDAATEAAMQSPWLKADNGVQRFAGYAADAGTAIMSPGQGLQKLASRGLGRRLMKWGLRPTPATLREFPTVIDDALDRGITLTPEGQADWQRRIRSSNSEAVQGVLDAPAQSVAVSDVMPFGGVQARTTAARLSRSNPARSKVMLSNVDAREDDIATNVFGEGPIDLMAAHQAKLGHQQDAERAYRQQIAGQAIKDEDLAFDQGMAREYRGLIESRAPRTAAANAETQKLIGIGQAMDTANTKAGSHILSEYFTVAGALSGNPQLAAPAALLASPKWASRIAVAIDKFKDKPDMLTAAIKAIALEATLAQSGADTPLSSHR